MNITFVLCGSCAPKNIYKSTVQGIKCRLMEHEHKYLLDATNVKFTVLREHDYK